LGLSMSNLQKFEQHCKRLDELGRLFAYSFTISELVNVLGFIGAGVDVADVPEPCKEEAKKFVAKMLAEMDEQSPGAAECYFSAMIEADAIEANKKSMRIADKFAAAVARQKGGAS